MMSVLIRPSSFKISEQFQLSACVALTIVEFFKVYAGDDSTIKWPNDLYWQDRKAGGILIESGVGSSSERTPSEESGVGKWKWAIAGIGININQTKFPEELINPVSLKQITGKDFDTIELAKELCSLLDKKFNELVMEGFEKIYNDYLGHLYKKDQSVKLKKDNRLFEGVIRSVSPSGKLIVEHAIEEEFDFGEIEWVL